MKALFLRAGWDDEARVWVATSDDVPGLATEAETVEDLIAKLEIMIPELLDGNEDNVDSGEPFEPLTRRFQTIRRQSA